MSEKLNQIFKMMDYVGSKKIKVPWYFSDKVSSKELHDKLYNNYRPDRYMTLDREGIITYTGSGDRMKGDVKFTLECDDKILDKIFGRLKETCVENARAKALIRLTNHELAVNELDFLAKE